MGEHFFNSTLSTRNNSNVMSSSNIVFTAAGIIFVSLVLTVTVIGDCLIYAAFYFHASVRTRVNSFFLSLTTGDLLQALLVMPLELVRIYYEPSWPLGVTATKLWNSMFVCFGTASAFNLAAISVDRYLTITRPLTHNHSIISKQTLLSIACVWMWAILSGVYSFFAWKTPQIPSSGFSISLGNAIPLLTLGVIIPFGVCAVAYFSIFRISLDHSYRINLLCGWTFNSHRARLAREKKSAITLSLLVGIFAVSSLPFFAFHVVDSAYNEQLPNRRYASHIVKWLCYLNSASNWALYGFLNQDFREVLYTMFKSCYTRICATFDLVKSNRVAPLR